MSESQYRAAHEAGYRLGFGDGKHEGLAGKAKSNSVWFLAGMLAGLAMGIALHLASGGGGV